MEKTTLLKESSIIVKKIEDLKLSESARMEALSALEIAEAWCNALAWVFDKVGMASVWVAPSPKLKHQ